jgi:hypothetical protein
MTARRLALSSCAWLALSMAACAAPSSQAPAAPADARVQAAGASEPQIVPATPRPATAAPARDLDKLRKLKVRTGGPLPPQTLPEPVKLDRSCRSDADCTVKNVGNCCGEYPACVNRDSPADPAAVMAQCAKTGSMSVCGYREIGGCSCVDGSCTALLQAIDPPVDPAPQPPEER